MTLEAAAGYIKHVAEMSFSLPYETRNLSFSKNPITKIIKGIITTARAIIPVLDLKSSRIESFSSVSRPRIGQESN